MLSKAGPGAGATETTATQSRHPRLGRYSSFFEWELELGRMQVFPRSMIAILAAIIVPTIAVVLPYASATISPDNEHGWLQTRNFAIIVLVIVAAHVIVLGMPAFLILFKAKLVRWWSAITAGFVLAAVPFGFWLWPGKYASTGSSSSQSPGGDTIHTMIDGVPTKDGWIEFVEVCIYFGAFGALGGLAFWMVWRVLCPNRAPE